MGECPAGLAELHGLPEVDGSDVPALAEAGIELEASCAFRGESIEGEAFYWVYYVAEPVDVIAYLGQRFTAAGYDAQGMLDTEGTWRSDDSTVGAAEGTEESDSTTFDLFSDPYVWVFIS